MRLARVRNPWTAGARPLYTLTESEFVAWLRKLADDPKWKAPTAWDEHTFRVGVQLELRRVQSPNDQAHPTAAESDRGASGKESNG